MTQPTAAEKKDHYFFVTGSALFTNPEDPENVARVTLNSVFTHDSRELQLRGISTGHKALYAAFVQKTSQTFKVVDLTIENIIYLGHMTADDFGQQPRESEEELAAKIKEAIGRPDLSLVPTPLDPMKGN